MYHFYQVTDEDIAPKLSKILQIKYLPFDNQEKIFLLCPLNASRSHHQSLKGPPNLRLAEIEEAEAKSMQECERINDLRLILIIMSFMNISFVMRYLTHNVTWRLSGGMVNVLFLFIDYVNLVRTHCVIAASPKLLSTADGIRNPQ